jgi:hypothetical protein
MKIYLSSTFEDLRDYRTAVDRVLRQMGHDVIGMEQYVAEQSTPLDRSTDDVRSADVYVVLVAWRYGYIPVHPDNPEQLSITELEYTAAVNAHKTILAFLLDPQEPWPPNWIDALTQASGANVLRFRSILGTKYLAGIFRTPDSLASLAATAIARQGINKQIVGRTLTLEPVTDSMMAFARGDGVIDDPSTIGSIRYMVTDAGNRAVRALRIDMGPDTWWSTRLYLLAALTQTLTSVRQFLFVRGDGHFGAMASPAAVREGLCSSFHKLAEFDSELRQGEISKDIEREIKRTLDLWKAKIQPQESTLRTGVRPQLLREWMSERLVDRCIEVHADTGLTMVHVQQLVESLLPDIPVEGPQDLLGSSLVVVDRDAFALELAREWVRIGLPRTPIV